MQQNLMTSRRFAPLFWTQFLSAFNDNFLKNTLVFLILATVAAEEAGSLVTLAGAVFMAPFLLFSGDKKLPKVVEDLGRLLPPAMMGLLVVYSLRSIDLMGGSHGIPEAIAVAVTAGLHLWRRNTLLSILAGTACYMLLVQLVF